MSSLLLTTLHQYYIVENSNTNFDNSSLTRDTLYGLTRLEILELQELDSLERFDSDVFSYLSSLRSLSVESYPNIEKYRFRLGKIASKL